jgi:ketosteroid isomerase-like protein
MSMPNRWKMRIIPMVILILVSGCDGTTTTKDSLVDGFAAALQAKNVDLILSYYSDDFVYLNVTIMDLGEVALADYQRVLRQGYAAGDGIFIPDQVYYKADQSGAALSGSLTALDKTGRMATVPMVMIVEIANGKITRQIDYFDRVRFIQ